MIAMIFLVLFCVEFRSGNVHTDQDIAVFRKSDSSVARLLTLAKIAPFMRRPPCSRTSSVICRRASFRSNPSTTGSGFLNSRQDGSFEIKFLASGGWALHRGRIFASHPAALGLILDIPEDLLFLEMYSLNVAEFY